jgi:hypothetical protein
VDGPVVVVEVVVAVVVVVDVVVDVVVVVVAVVVDVVVVAVVVVDDVVVVVVESVGTYASKNLVTKKNCQMLLFSFDWAQRNLRLFTKPLKADCVSR